jgi:beta-phosphoglucomutase-like phosphatase (HAD superfamily)
VPSIFVLFDVDNTLLNTDLAVERIQAEMRSTVGAEHARRFWEIYEEVRTAGDSVNIPDSLERFSLECPDLRAVSRMSALIYGFDFEGCLFPGAIEAIEHALAIGGAAILSDGDQLYQRHKISVAGLEQAVGGNVMVQKHKEEVLSLVATRFPADHYVALDDKPFVLARMKAVMGAKLTTIQVCQGKYAGTGTSVARPDLEIDDIAHFKDFSAAQLAEAG